MNDTTYQTVCVWIVTIAGSVVVCAFAAYFVTVIARLIREVSRSSSTASIVERRLQPPHHLRCVRSLGGVPCAGTLGPIEKLDLTDEGVFECRTCALCGQPAKIKQTAAGQ